MAWDDESGDWDSDPDLWDHALENVTEGITAGDSSSVVASSVVSQEEIFGIEDTATAVSSIVEAVLEGVTNGDTVGVIVNVILNDIGEIVAAGDSVAIVCLSDVSVAEAFSFADSSGIIVGAVDFVGDVCIVTDGVVVVATANANVADSVALLLERLNGTIDGWDFNYDQRANSNWNVLQGRSDVWSKVGGVSSDWQSDLPYQGP